MRHLLIYSMILLLPCFSFGDKEFQWITCKQSLSQQTGRINLSLILFNKIQAEVNGWHQKIEDNCFAINLSNTLSNRLQVVDDEIVVEFSTTSDYTFQCHLKNLIPGNECLFDVCELCDECC